MVHGSGKGREAACETHVGRATVPRVNTFGLAGRKTVDRPLLPGLLVNVVNVCTYRAIRKSHDNTTAHEPASTGNVNMCLRRTGGKFIFIRQPFFRMARNGKHFCHSGLAAVCEETRLLEIFGRTSGDSPKYNITAIIA